jgi:hypothetical protein
MDVLLMSRLIVRAASTTLGIDTESFRAGREKPCMALAVSISEPISARLEKLSPMPAADLG